MINFPPCETSPSTVRNDVLLCKHINIKVSSEKWYPLFYFHSEQFSLDLEKKRDFFAQFFQSVAESFRDRTPRSLRSFHPRISQHVAKTAARIRYPPVLAFSWWVHPIKFNSGLFCSSGPIWQLWAQSAPLIYYFWTLKLLLIPFSISEHFFSISFSI